jgi:CRP-like cAMP-binding protein
MSDAQESNFDKPVAYKKGQVIFVTGEPSSYLYLVKSGEITIFLEDRDRLMPISIIEAEEFLGELAMFNDDVRTACAVATKHSEVYIVKKSEIKNVLRHCPEWVSQIMATLSERLVHSIDVLREHRIMDERLQKRAELNPNELGQMRKSIEEFRTRRGLKK